MSRTIYALMVLIIALTSVVNAQKTNPTNATTSPVKQTGGQSNSMVEDCACESQILPETVAIVNKIKISSSDIKKATKQTVSELQSQVIQARKNELDLTSAHTRPFGTRVRCC